MLVAHHVDESDATVNVDDVLAAGVADEGADDVNADVVLTVIDDPSVPSPTLPTQPPLPSQNLPSTSQVQPTPPPSPIAQPPSPQQQPQSSQDAEISLNLLHNLLETCTTLTRRGRIIVDIDADVDVTMKDIAKDVVVDAEIKDSAYVQGRQAESQAQIYQIDLEHADKVLNIQDDEVEPAELQEVVEVVTTAKLITEVVIVASATIIVAALKLTTAFSVARRRKGVVIRDPEETTTPSTIIHSEAKSKDKWERDFVQRKEKEDNAVMRYQALKRKPQIEAQARKNMIIYLRNMKTKEHMEEEDSKALKRISESQEDKAAKKQKLDEEVEELRKHLQIVLNDDDDAYTEATPLALKVSIVDYDIYAENNKPYYNIKRADGTH
nr:hypothetical protein [Tanacetum cinerariifolium]